MGFLTTEELGSLRIRKMILHVVGGEGEFRPERARPVEHTAFFIDRIRDTDVAPIFEFEEVSLTKSTLTAMATGAQTFVAGAQALSREFSRQHVAASRDGAFFIFEMTTDTPGVTIYSLIKYDYHQVIEQSDTDEGTSLRQIVQAFVDDKRAIQKAALVRITDGVADMGLCAIDRARAAPDISDYFSTFLDVKRTRTDAELSQTLRTVVRKVLTECQDVLPDQDPARAFHEAVDILRRRQQISEEAITEAILSAAGDPDDEDVRVRLQNKTQKKLRRAKLDGLAFRPDRSVLRRPPRRRLRTTEGVIILYDEANDGVVQRAKQRDGGEVITIRTAHVEDDKIVPDRTR